MRPYVLQNLKTELGEVESARLIAAQGTAIRTVEPEGTEITIQPENMVIYQCGEVTALSLSDFPECGTFALMFTSGAAATVLAVPNTLHIPDDFTVEANTRYEMNVRNGYALVAGWAVSAL